MTFDEVLEQVMALLQRHGIGTAHHDLRGNERQSLAGLPTLLGPILLGQR